MSATAIGSPAPAFAVLDHDAQPFASTDLAGQAYVLWFYPKASTPG
jgi:peroxiredoxin